MQSPSPDRTRLEIPTYVNFIHLDVECFPNCHFDYPQFELAIVVIESGGRAWLCCSLDCVLNSSKRAVIEESPNWKDLMRSFGESPDSSA